jgi:hypothetical protein
MKKVANRMGLVFAVVAACLMCCLISFSSGQKPEVEVRTITTLEEMRHELSHVQLNTLPTGLELVVVDGGEYLFAPAAGDLAAGMLTGALIPSESGGRRCWPVTLVEDFESRDMIIRDAEGGEAVRLPCDPDYHPDWAFDMLFPLSSHIANADAYDPARVALAMRLVLREEGSVPKNPALPSPAKPEVRPPSAQGLQAAPQAMPAKAPASLPSVKQASTASPLSASAGKVMAAAYSTVISDPDSDGDGLSDSAELSLGKVVAWGQNSLSQCTVPVSLTNAVAIAAGANHTLALRRDRTLVAWGENTAGQCTVPASATNIVSVAAGGSHSLALRSDGVVAAWGQNANGQCVVPASASNAVALAAGSSHSLALRPGGTVVAWGNNAYGQCTVPAGLTNVIALAAGDYHSLALRANGTIVAWGQNTYQQCFVPASAASVVAIAAGPMHNLAVLANGTVVAWGANNSYYNTRLRRWLGVNNPYGQCTVPPAATGVVAVAVGSNHSLALRKDGKVISWGLNDVGQCSGASNVTYAASVASGLSHGLVLRRTNPFNKDTDGDGLPDGWEVSQGLDPLNAVDASQDADNDGLTNLAEFTNKTNPRNADTDGDSLTDGWEGAYGFNPLIPDDATRDTDGDGLSDGVECLNRTNPKVADTDGDGMPDGWEVSHGFNPLTAVDAAQDVDGDGLTNRTEFTNKTDPRNVDTDGDGMPDGWELANRLNPLNPEDALLDLDQDGISNRKEYDMGSDPSAGYFMKETFDNGIPSDWTLQASPDNRFQWTSLSGSGSLKDIAKPYGGKGLNVGIAFGPAANPARLTTPWLNLGWNMTNVVLNFYYCNPSLTYYGDTLIIYFRTQALEGPSTVTEKQILCLGEITSSVKAWKLGSVRLPNPRGKCQIAFEYWNCYGLSSHGVYVDEMSIAGDYGRMSQDLAPLVIETASALPSASRGIPYSTRLSVRGGLSPFLWRCQWAVVSNALPLGLALDRNTGIISGTPASLGASSFSIEAQSEDGKAATNQFALLVREPAVALSEKFDSGWLPRGWTQERQNAQCMWSAMPGASPFGIAGSNACYKGNGSAIPLLISPVMDLSKSTSNVVLRFWYRNPKAIYMNYRDYLIVYCMDGPNLTSLAASASICSSSQSEVPIPDSDTWRQSVLVLPRLSATSRIAFGGCTITTGVTPNPGAGVFLDDVEVLADYGDPAFLAWLAKHFPDGKGSGFYDDPDADSLTNLQEYLKGTDPHNSDTDGDGLKDGDEVARGTNPLIKDSDNDGLEDGAEVNSHHTNPLDPDTDHDGLRDGDELLYGTDPLNPDTDGDGMSDGWEVRYGYPPRVKDDPNKDSDGDGLTDGEEARAGTDPRIADTDGDGVSDAIEVRYGLNPNQFTVYVDSDKDGLPDKLEKAMGTDPANWDSDGDGLADGWEFYGGLDPLSAAGNNGQAADPDGDGLANLEEYINGTCPTKVDTDGDGVNDAIEGSQGSDPSDPSDKGQPPPASELVEVPFSIGGDYAAWEMKVQGQGPQDKRTLLVITEKPGNTTERKFKLRKGNSYKITMKWRSSIYSSYNWYCWEAMVGSLPQITTFDNYSSSRKPNAATTLFGNGFYIDNKDGLLTSHVHMRDDQGGNVAEGLSAMLYVLKATLVPDYDRDGKIDAADRVQSDAGEPFRLWINDDKDVGDEDAAGGTDVPGQSSEPNCKDVMVNGRRDLMDFFPVLINVGDFENLCGAPDSYRIKQADKAVNIVFTSLYDSNAGSYLTKDIGSCGTELRYPLSSATILNVGDEGFTLSPVLMAVLRQSGGKGVFLVEGVKESSAPLILEAIKGGLVIFSSELPMFVKPVEAMYTRVNLRSGTVITPPVNPPDNNGKNVIFVHGFCVDEQGARAWNSEMFKRLYQSSSNAKFYGTTWNSNVGKADGSFNYHGNVVNAFNIASALKTVVNNINGDKILMAHSLGNMVVSSAIQDQNMYVSKYFMLNAAVPAEAYDEAAFSATPANNLTHVEWASYTNSSWSAMWYRLFSPEVMHTFPGNEDDKYRLTWKGRFVDVASKAYNFYSTGDETLEIYNGTPSAAEGIKFHLGLPVVTGTERYAWHKQEIYKGRGGEGELEAIFGTDMAGWGFEKKKVGDYLYPFYSASQANAEDPQTFTTMPVFRWNPQVMFANTISQTNKNMLLSKAIPALSIPAGDRTLTSIALEKNIDMNIMGRPNGWGRTHDTYGTRWLHSDLKNVAYFYVHPLFTKFVEKGELK